MRMFCHPPRTNALPSSQPSTSKRQIRSFFLLTDWLSQQKLIISIRVPCTLRCRLCISAEFSTQQKTQRVLPLLWSTAIPSRLEDRNIPRRTTTVKLLHQRRYRKIFLTILRSAACLSGKQWHLLGLGLAPSVGNM